MALAISTEGLHPTTESCLEALQWLHGEMHFHNILDMGCGNGILSVTAASIWDCRVLAVDISEKAVDDTRQMAASHRLTDDVTAVRSDGFSNPLIFERSPYDLICFNLLAEPIIRLASQVKTHLDKGGMCILSGILAWQAVDVANTYKALGLELVKEYTNTPWHTHVYCHKTVTANS